MLQHKTNGTLVHDNSNMILLLLFYVLNHCWRIVGLFTFFPHYLFRFHIILDTQGPSCYKACLNLCASSGHVVTLVTPLNSMTDKHGLVWGAVKATCSRLKIGLPQVRYKVSTAPIQIIHTCQLMLQLI